MDSSMRDEAFRHAQRQARPALAVATLAAVGVAGCGALYDRDWVPALVVVAICTPWLWLIGQGYVWPRWLLVIVSATVGIMGMFQGISELLISSREAAWSNISAASLLIVCASTLYGSEALRELGETRRNGGRPLDWVSVSLAPPRIPDAQVVALLNRNLMLRRRCGNFASALVLVSGWLTWLLFIGTTLWLLSLGQAAVSDIVRGMQNQSSPFGLLWMMSYFMVVAAVFSYIVLCFLALSFGPFAVSLPLILPLALLWKQPARFLILRPFNRNEVSRSLRRVLRNEVAPLGHCYTLADADIRISPVQRVPLLYGQLSFFKFRQRKIIVPRHLATLVRDMNRRVARNINWAVSRDKIFPVASVDAAWRACVKRLMGECDGIIMDLSGISENIRWELELLRSSGAVSDTVFVVDREQESTARSLLQKTFGYGGVVPALVSYDQFGLAIPGQLMSQIIPIVEGRPRKSRSAPQEDGEYSNVTNP